MPLPFQLRNHHGHAVMEHRPPPPPPAARVSVFRRLLVRVSSAERVQAVDGKDDKPPETEVGSLGLDRMVQSFMEDAAAVESRPPQRGCCNCFHGSGHHDSSDDEAFDFLPSGHSAPSSASKAPAGDTLEALKGLVQSSSVAERNLLADASRIAERCRKGGKKKADVRRAVADGLRALGHDAGVCKSRWDKTPSFPAGEHEYIDAVLGETSTARLIVEVDFRSEFEVARSTKAYRAVLQALPSLFVGTPDRLGQIVAVVAEAARQSLKKKGLHFPPWRKPEYMRAKWLSAHVRCSDDSKLPSPTPVSTASFTGEFELRFDRKPKGLESAPARDEDGSIVEQKIMVVVSPSPWRPVGPEARKKRPIAGLASVL
ncbi:hypothetical protein QYE76_042839 [Lolium multiflorum]|uniref:Plant-specific domain TIGR01615 family protein n=1 Tax=Lolium multiflorum TaxID=4521 RepID=A0AAD8WXD1_LOLMU|nr:hypothetical protein QYE76_042839 [Lolium multiflorum]